MKPSLLAKLEPMAERREERDGAVAACLGLASRPGARPRCACRGPASSGFSELNEHHR
ncbi:hypothetical protein [Solimonas flava]|uniref:hypothetical protein n=1 Tax=Solimonas flava TaxID=415849 RepID=UPI0012B581B4|nr:hypothetical protein [Solimonas flava]